MNYTKEKLFRTDDFPCEIREILEKLHRVELIPVKEGVKAVHVKREGIRTSK